MDTPTITGSMLQLYRQQFETLQNMASISLSGFERTQQSAIEMYRRAFGQQLELANRANSQATQSILDPEAVRPALEGLWRAQRDMAQALNETQHRCLQAISNAASSDQSYSGADIASSYADAMRQSIDRWQRLTEQMFQVAREQTEGMARDASSRAQQMQNDVRNAVNAEASGQRRPEARDVSSNPAARKPDQQQQHKSGATARVAETAGT